MTVFAQEPNIRELWQAAELIDLIIDIGYLLIEEVSPGLDSFPGFSQLLDFLLKLLQSV